MSIVKKQLCAYYGTPDGLGYAFMILPHRKAGYLDKPEALRPRAGGFTLTVLGLCSLLYETTLGLRPSDLTS